MTPDDYAEWESQKQYEGLLIEEARALCGELEAAQAVANASGDMWRGMRIAGLLTKADRRFERRAGADVEV